MRDPLGRCKMSALAREETMNRLTVLAVTCVLGSTTIARCAKPVRQPLRAMASDSIPSAVQCLRNAAIGAGFMISEWGPAGGHAYRRGLGPGSTELQDQLAVRATTDSVGGTARVKIHTSSFLVQRGPDGREYLTDRGAPSSDVLRVVHDVETECGIR